MVLMDASRTPLAVDIAPADQHEAQLIEPLLNRAVVGLPTRRLPLVYDKAADSDGLRDRLEQAGFELVCPHRKSRVRPPRQDGRKLRGKDRWRIERLNAWLKNLRRVRTRDEIRPDLYHAFASIACLFTILKTF
jgi:transposase